MTTSAATAPAINDTFQWEGGPTFTIISISENPEAGFRGNFISPYMTVQWSDSDKPSSLTLLEVSRYIAGGTLARV